MIKKSALIAALALCLSPALAADVYIDVRSPQEYQEYHIDGTVNIVHTDIVAGVQKQNISKDDNIYVFCRSGKRAGAAKAALNEAGYPKVENLGGVLDAVRYINSRKE